jgi:hypothetical protein
MSEATSSVKQKKAMHRSPSYPVFSLAEAIEKVRVIYSEDKRVFTTPDVIAKHLGFSHHIGGPGGRVMSALRQYGLLEESAGKSRISERAYTLIQYPIDSTERKQAVKAAIREPNLFRELLADFGDSVPSDAALHSNLLKRGFNPEFISDVIRVFRETMALDSDQSVDYSSIHVGDYVQWESQGVLHFDKPKRISKLSDDGQFAFFDGSSTGVPIDQLTKADAPTEEREDGGKLVVKRTPPKPGMNSDVFTLQEGEVILQWPSQMSPESYEDFKDWIELMTRKAKRSVKSPDDPAKLDPS